MRGAHGRHIGIRPIRRIKVAERFAHSQSTIYCILLQFLFGVAKRLALLCCFRCHRCSRRGCCGDRKRVVHRGPQEQATCRWLWRLQFFSFQADDIQNVSEAEESWQVD